MTTHKHSLGGKYTSSVDVPIPSVTGLVKQADFDKLAARVTALEKPVAKPPAPTNLRATKGNHSVTLAWA